jgi:hypothetical protein
MSDVPADNPISTTDLDTEFPVPGQDNDSQGFRDNFTVINDNFSASKARLEDLETYTVRNEANTEFLALGTGGTARLVNPTLQSQREVKYNVGTVSTNATVYFNNQDADTQISGNYQTIVLEGDTELTIDAGTSPDSGYYQKVTLHITATGSTRNLTWDNSLTIKFDNDSEDFWNRDTTGISSVTTGDVHIIELWTYQGSTTYYAKYIGSFD